MIDVGNFRDEICGSTIDGGLHREVARNTTAQIHRFSHVDHPSQAVFHQIDARGPRQCPHFGFDVVFRIFGRQRETFDQQRDEWSESQMVNGTLSGKLEKVNDGLRAILVDPDRLVSGKQKYYSHDKQ